MCFLCKKSYKYKWDEVVVIVLDSLEFDLFHMVG